MKLRRHVRTGTVLLLVKEGDSPGNVDDVFEHLVPEDQEPTRAGDVQEV